MPGPAPYAVLMGDELDRIDPCPRGCGHGWHGNPCADRMYGLRLNIPRHAGCTCPGAFPDERTTA